MLIEISCDKNYINEKLYGVNIEEQKKDTIVHKYL